MINEVEINIHAVLPASTVNGPGRRLVVFFQGCGRGCAECFNTDTHPREPRRLYTPSALLDEYLGKAVEGLTVSGGEPFDQPDGLSELLRLARTRYGLTTVVYTGYTIEEIRADERRAACLEHVDVLIDGPFVERLKEPTLLARGSTNQSIHLLTDRYSLEEFVMRGRVEVIIGKDGNVIETGFSKAAASAA